MPEPITDWNIEPGPFEELSVARARLVNVFDLGARELQPDVSAVAQARFDCWIEQQEEGWQTNDINICRNGFIEALNELEAAIPAQAPPPAPEPDEPFDVDASEPMAPENAMYLVFFDFDESALGPGAQTVLDSVAQEVSGRSVNVVNVVGHADTSGSKAYNRKLAMKRANSVRDALIDQGPKVKNGQTVRINRPLRPLGNEVIHHPQKAGGQEKANRIVTIPPLNHSALDPASHFIALRIQ